MIDASTYGPWAVIAGGSEGVGAAFARQLAEAGVHLVLIARKPGPLEETAQQVREYGVQARTLSLDLLAPDAVPTIVRETRDLDVGLLIFNAGANSYGSEFVHSDMDRVQQVIDLNITAQLGLCRHFGEQLKQRGRGGIILLGSLAGYLGHEHIGIYAASKAFGRIFAEGLWLELKEHGVHVLELVLGVTRTPAMERAGLRMDLPGVNVAEPEDVASEGLEHIADGPVRVAGGNEETARQRGGEPRDRLVEKNAEGLRRMIGRS